MNAQPTLQVAFKGDWGCFPNKQFTKIDPEGKSRKCVNLYRFTLLAKQRFTLYWLKKFPTWKFLRNNFVPNWREVLTSIIYFRPTWSKVKFLKSYTPKDNFIPIGDEVKILRFRTFRQYVGKFFGKNQSPAYCRGLIRNLNLSFGATCTEVTDMGSV